MYKRIMRACARGIGIVKISKDINVYCTANPKQEAADVDEAEPIESDIGGSGVDHNRGSREYHMKK
jgi:hypothetical protein